MNHIYSYSLNVLVKRKKAWFSRVKWACWSEKVWFPVSSRAHCVFKRMLSFFVWLLCSCVFALESGCSGVRYNRIRSMVDFNSRAYYFVFKDDLKHYTSVFGQSVLVARTMVRISFTVFTLLFTRLFLMVSKKFECWRVSMNLSGR
ncbi:hypothetical protein BDF21DRAFT_401827 [Thamnidium elegans]|nr:hypothetical protein BDF21DRAFT_401827 [Thamnidium elegans]